MFAELDEFDAELAAAFADALADAASTNNSYKAELAFVVSGCDPEDVCAVLTINILLVEVSLTISLPA